VPVDDPAHVARLVLAQEKRLRKLEAPALGEDPFDGPHGLKEAVLVPLQELAEHLGHLLARTLIK